MRSYQPGMYAIRPGSRKPKINWLTENTFQSAVGELVHDALIGMDADEVIRYWNQAAEALFGWTAEEAIGHKAGEWIRSDMTDLLKQRAFEMLQRQQKVSFQAVIYAKDGRPRAVEVNLTHLKQPSGRLSGYAAALREIAGQPALVEQLASANAQFEALIAHIPAGVVVSDAEGQIILTNQAAQAMVHGPLTGDVFNPQDGFSMFHLDGTPFPANELPLAVAIRSGAPTEVAELLIRHSNGEEIFLEVSAAPYFDPLGRYAGAIAVMQNVTQRHKEAQERARMLEALQKSEERFRTSVENLQYGFAIFSAVRAPDTGGQAGRGQPGKIVDFRYEYINEAGCRLNNRSYEEQVGKMLLDLLPAHRESGFFERYVRLVETGEPVHEDNSYYEDVFGGGQRRGQVCDLRAVKLGDGFVVTWQDVSQRRQVEERLQLAMSALQYSEERFRSAILAAPFPIMIHNEQGRVIAINAAWTDSTGYSAKELPSLAAWSEKAGGILHQLVPAAQTAEGEMLVVTSSGEERIWDFYAAPLGSDAQGKGLVIRIAVDVTSRKAAEQAIQQTNQKLERSNRELEQFAFVASHDLQEPLRKIHQFAKSVQNQVRQNQYANVNEYLERMERSATRMQAMIDGLLELSRINTRGGVFQHVDLSQIVEEVISDLEPRIQSNGGEVMCETMPTIEADPLQIRQLLQNLIGNALKFHRPETAPQVHIYTQLDLSSARGEPSLTIVVEDQGIGFDPQFAERIFQPFQRLHGRSQYEGTGMGLAICKKIVERHRGSIEVVSQPGQGTAFFITLPIKQA